MPSPKTVTTTPIQGSQPVPGSKERGNIPKREGWKKRSAAPTARRAECASREDVACRATVGAVQRAAIIQAISHINQSAATVLDAEIMYKDTNTSRHAEPRR